MATEVHIGGRLEAVAPRRVTDAADRARLLALVAVAVAVHVLVVGRTAVTARDSLEFARLALQFKEPAAVRVPDDPADARMTVADVLRRAKHPPGFPVAVLLASQAVRAAAPNDPLPDQMLLAAQVASATAAVLLVFPTYWLGRLLFGKFVGFAAALLFQVLPVPARVTSDGLTEGLYLLALGTALLLGVRAVRKPGIGGFLVCGLATGLTYLVRPEGLLAGAAVGLVIVGLVVTRRWAVGDGAARGTALVVGFALTAAPYIALIGGLTNKPTGKDMMPPVANPRESVAAVGGPVLFADWYVPDAQGASAVGKAVWVAKALAVEGGKAFHYVPAVFAALGLWLAARRLRAEPWVWVPILYAGMLLGVLTLVGWSKDYISERHTLSVVYVGCLFAGLAIETLPRWVGRGAGWLPGLALAVLVASCLPALPKVLHRERLGHVHAGRYLKDVLRPEDALIDPFEWAGFYSGRTLTHIPPDPPGHTISYAVLEQSDSSHSRLPRLQAALDVKADGRSAVVFRWPEENPRVMVYRLDTAKK